MTVQFLAVVLREPPESGGTGANAADSTSSCRCNQRGPSHPDGNTVASAGGDSTIRVTASRYRSRLAPPGP